MTWLKQATLQNDYCTLKPLLPEHHDDLVEAVADGEVWKTHYALVPHPTDMKKRNYSST